MVLVALVVMTLVATVSGTLDTLVPLRMGQAGYSALAITAVLTAAGVLATACNYGVGRLFDRIGGDADRGRRDARDGRPRRAPGRVRRRRWS